MSALLCIPLELKTEAVEPKEAIASDWNVEWGRGVCVFLGLGYGKGQSRGAGLGVDSHGDSVLLNIFRERATSCLLCLTPSQESRVRVPGAECSIPAALKFPPQLMSSPCPCWLW